MNPICSDAEEGIFVHRIIFYSLSSPLEVDLVGKAIIIILLFVGVQDLVLTVGRSVLNLTSVIGLILLPPSLSTRTKSATCSSLRHTFALALSLHISLVSLRSS
jgi:hypothetical protein